MFVKNFFIINIINIKNYLLFISNKIKTYSQHKRIKCRCNAKRSKIYIILSTSKSYVDVDRMMMHQSDMLDLLL